jgi:predicted amidohydrolase
MKFTIALAQIDPVLGDMEHNIAVHVDRVRNAEEAGADLVVFPELSLTGYSVKDMNWDLAVNLNTGKDRLAPLLEASRTVSVLAGGIEESDSFHMFNAAFLFEEGTVRSVHRKSYPPTYGLFEEMRYFSSGGTVRAVNTRWGRLGVIICEDMWHLALPYILAYDGASVIVSLVASPTRLNGTSESLAAATVNSENHRAYARLLSTYVAFCNRVGYEDGVNFWGGSEVVGPDGTIIAAGRTFEEDLVVATIDDNSIRRARRFSRHFLDERMGLVIAELTRIDKKRKKDGDNR